MLNIKTTFVATTLAIAAAGAFAQTTAAPATPRVDQREVKQEQRIQQGVNSGQLTAKETHHLDKQQARVAGAEATAKADGTVTKQERHHLHKMQNHASTDIAHQKHDAQTASK